MAQILYHFSKSEKKEQLLTLCRKLGLQTKELFAADAEKTIALLAGLPELSAAKEEKRSFFLLPDLILFCGISSLQLDGFLAAYRKAGIEQTPLKAMVTPANRSWTLRQLVEELQKESRAFGNK